MAPRARLERTTCGLEVCNGSFVNICVPVHYAANQRLTQNRRLPLWYDVVPDFTFKA